MCTCFIFVVVVVVVFFCSKQMYGSSRSSYHLSLIKYVLPKQSQEIKKNLQALSSVARAKGPSPTRQNPRPMHLIGHGPKCGMGGAIDQ